MDTRTEFQIGQPVKHARRKLHSATFLGYTKTGRVKVQHNAGAPWGVIMVVDTFAARNIEAEGKPNGH